jgi:hypothetical protein
MSDRVESGLLAEIHLEPDGEAPIEAQVTTMVCESTTLCKKAQAQTYEGTGRHRE